jgi:acid phosphatase family membrane protein YuiD
LKLKSKFVDKGGAHKLAPSGHCAVASKLVESYGAESCYDNKLFVRLANIFSIVV